MQSKERPFVLFVAEKIYSKICKIKKIKPLTKWYKTFGLEKISEKNINQVSGGEQQKTYLSRIMSVNLKVIILDEPSQNLDKESDRKLIQLLLEEKIQDHEIRWMWVKGHDENIFNEKADMLAKKAIES